MEVLSVIAQLIVAISVLIMGFCLIISLKNSANELSDLTRMIVEQPK
jgi:uncharacterized protein YoxC